MYCKKCGAQLSDNAVLCEKCGTLLLETEEELIDFINAHPEEAEAWADAECEKVKDMPLPDPIVFEKMWRNIRREIRRYHFKNYLKLVIKKIQFIFRRF